MPNHNGIHSVCTEAANGTRPSHRKSSPKLINQNKAWFERLTSQGKAKPGRALERTGVTVSGKNGRFVIDGPFAESKEAIGGYLVLDVETIEEAIASRPGQS